MPWTPRLMTLTLTPGQAMLAIRFSRVTEARQPLLRSRQLLRLRNRRPRPSRPLLLLQPPLLLQPRHPLRLPRRRPLPPQHLLLFLFSLSLQVPDAAASQDLELEGVGVGVGVGVG